MTERRALEQERERLLRQALTARDEAQAAQARAEAAREEAEAARRRAGFLSTVTGRMAASLDYEATLEAQSRLVELAHDGAVPDGVRTLQSRQAIGAA